ncbi:Expansin-B3 isoform A [Glycine soja]|uniref:Expansin-B3 isoform A n=2 Tax=Glycine soja TaxID=3848 RepID=A0A445HT22_GLYSO|nr:Expansin-B3 isoform A [Glycine soja]
MQCHRVSAVLFLSLCFRIALVYAQGEPHLTALDQHWFPGTATWYGDPEGDGSTGGACGYGTLVDVKPLKARVGAVGSVLFKKGEGCGACYKVKCLDHSICSKRAVTVIITDECPGCPSDRTHFDLSGSAFGRMAVVGENGQLVKSQSFTAEHRASMLAKTLPSMSMKVPLLFGYPFWWSLKMEMGTLAPCIYKKQGRVSGSR